MKYEELQEIGTPAYVFSEPEFASRIAHVKEVLGDRVRPVYAMKANPFLTECVKALDLSVEICSPGELRIAEKAGLPASGMVLSGVNKEEPVFRNAVQKYGEEPLYTAESPQQIALLEKLGEEAGLRLPVILRVTSGNQFGMDEKEVEKAVAQRASLPGIRIRGIQYFSGTQKRLAQTLKEIARMDDFLAALKEQYDYEAELFEFGPGLFVTYFEGEDGQTEEEGLRAVAKALSIMRFSGEIAAEMGRFLAAPCGYYITAIADCKKNRDTLYCILDGGIHQINYYGQMMAMKVPHLLVRDGSRDTKVMLCGSLCTTADILVRETCLPEPRIGDKIVFTRCGAYAVTEGISLFLTRDLPAVYTYDGEHFRLRRKNTCTEDLNYG